MSSNFNIEESDALKEIVKVTDEDFNISPVYHKEKTTIRLGSRGIVLNNKGEIAVIYKKLRMNTNYLVAVLIVTRKLKRRLGVSVKKSWGVLST